MRAAFFRPHARLPDDMTDLAFNTADTGDTGDIAGTERAPAPTAGLQAVFAWLATPASAHANDELAALRTHLAALRDDAGDASERARALDLLYTRCMATTEKLVPALRAVELPVPRKTRQMVRGMQGALLSLATLLQNTDPALDTAASGLPHDPPRQRLWRCLNALSRHLLISYRVAAPSGVGVWRQLHTAYATARRLRLANKTPDGERCTLQHVYYAAVLIGCAQPSAFTPREIDFIAAYLERFADEVELLGTDRTGNDGDPGGLFWIDPERDAPGFAWARKPPPPETAVLSFSCDRLAALLQRQLAALDAGQTPQQIGLPAFAAGAAGRGVLRRLAGYWGKPMKRRFQRRRQNYRAILCSGLDNLWQLLRDGQAAAETSNWMITNESPDGFALMHVAGKTGKLAVGDVAAIRTEASKDWQICIARWALSENPEHFELGLQVLSPRAFPAQLALFTNDGENRQLPALILPELPPLRETETLIVPSDQIPAQPKKLVLVLEQNNIVVRELRICRLEEQTASIESYTIQSERTS